MTWLNANGLRPEFHDFKKKGITFEKLSEWCDVFGWEKVLNKQGTTWRKLDSEKQGSVVDKESAIAVLLSNTSAIKRPIVELNGKALLIGFNEEEYVKIL